jgi:hypothetical protein
MNATIAENLIGQREIVHEKIRLDYKIYDQIVEVDSAGDSMIFSIVDFFMVLVVYLGPVVAFGYFVAPVAARLLRMPVSY